MNEHGVLYISKTIALEAARWFLSQRLPTDEWVRGPDIAQQPFEIMRCRTGIYEFRWVNRSLEFGIL